MSTELSTGHSAPNYLTQANGDKIAYHFSAPAPEYTGANVIFLHGLMSDMQGGKALAVEEFCRQRGIGCLRFDCYGHGQSDGRFQDGTLSRWSDDTVSLLDEVAQGPQVLVGSSMGGWNMLLSALKRPERIKGLLGLAAAPDFTEDLMRQDLNADQLSALKAQGHIEIACDYGDDPYVISQKLLDDGQKNLLLRDPLNLNIPVRLIHGMQDDDVPWQTALKLQDVLQSDDVEITFVKNGDHRLSEPHHLDRLCATLDRLLQQVNAQL